MPDITFPALLLFFSGLGLVIYLVRTKKIKLTLSSTIVLTLIFGISLTIIIKMKTGERELKREYKEFFKNFNVSFKGEVGWTRTFKGNSRLQIGAGAKFNIYYLKILETNTKFYDPSDTTEDFYCIINDTVGLVIEETLHENIGIGDILEYDGYKDIMYQYETKEQYELKSGEKVWLGDYDTILLKKWRPDNIIGHPHRAMFYNKFKDDWPILLNNHNNHNGKGVDLNNPPLPARIISSGNEE